MKISLLLLSFLLLGYGDNGSSSNLEKVTIKPLIEGRLFYEENLCEDPEFTTYMVKSNHLYLKRYNDNNYSELVSSDIYPIEAFEDDTMVIKKDGDLLTCAVGYEITDKNEVTMLEMDCVDANDTESANTLFFFAYDTKESAHKNRNECQ